MTQEAMESVFNVFGHIKDRLSMSSINQFLVIFCQTTPLKSDHTRKRCTRNSPIISGIYLDFFRSEESMLQKDDFLKGLHDDIYAFLIP